MSAVRRLTSWSCRVPLDVPIRFRWHQITHRDYAVLQLESDTGEVGHAFAITRGLPIDIAISDMLAPTILGTDPAAIADFHGRADAATAASDRYGIVQNARSLADIALWDLRGRELGEPLWRLFGGTPGPVGVLLVEGYELPGESDEAFAQRIAARATQGYPAVKLEAAGYTDLGVLRRRLERIRELAPELQLVVDVNGAWGSVAEAVRAIEAFATVELAWVEDPFPRHRIGESNRLAQEVDVPIGAGDDITDPRLLMGLVEDARIGLLRIDVATLGGFDSTHRVVAYAREAGLPVSTHAYPSLHLPLVLAEPNIAWLEAFPEELPFEPSDKLLTSTPYAKVAAGHTGGTDAPGLDTRLDLAAVERYAVRKQELTA